MNLVSFCSGLTAISFIEFVGPGAKSCDPHPPFIVWRLHHRNHVRIMRREGRRVKRFSPYRWLCQGEVSTTSVRDAPTQTGTKSQL